MSSSDPSVVLVAGSEITACLVAGAFLFSGDAEPTTFFFIFNNFSEAEAASAFSFAVLSFACSRSFLFAFVAGDSATLTTFRLICMSLPRGDERVWGEAGMCFLFGGMITNKLEHNKEAATVSPVVTVLREYHKVQKQRSTLQFML